MDTYVAIINGKAVLAFRAEDDDEARAIIEDEGGSMRSDLRALAGMDGKSLWDGKSAIEVREARPHNTSNGSSLATKQFATGKSTLMLATIQTSGTSI
jgi:hypothetical protein